MTYDFASPPSEKVVPISSRRRWPDSPSADRAGKQLLRAWLDIRQPDGACRPNGWGDTGGGDFLVAGPCGQVDRRIVVKSTAGPFETPVPFSLGELREIACSRTPHDLYRLSGVTESTARLNPFHDVAGWARQVLGALPAAPAVDVLQIDPAELGFGPTLVLDLNPADCSESPPILDIADVFYTGCADPYDSQDPYRVTVKVHGSMFEALRVVAGLTEVHAFNLRAGGTLGLANQIEFCSWESLKVIYEAFGAVPDPAAAEIDLFGAYGRIGTAGDLRKAIRHLRDDAPVLFRGGRFFVATGTGSAAIDTGGWVESDAIDSRSG